MFPLEYRWIIRDNTDDGYSKTLAQTLNVPISLAKVLASRGMINQTDANRFLSPSLEEIHDPFLMSGMDIASDRVCRAIKNDELIWIHGDYDVDGTTSTAMTLLFLKEMGARVQYFVPDRLGGGYGLSVQSINKAKDCNATLIIAVDCGITSVEPVQYAKDNGIDTIICDHHEPAEILPEAIAILDPLQSHCTYPFKSLSACGVAFKLIQAISIKLHKPELAYTYLDFVAISSAADIVALTGENRILVHYGLELFNSHPRPGFLGLLDCADMRPGALNTTNIVFGIAPRINAAGRLGDARRAVEMMIASDEYTAFSIAQELERDNRKRRILDEFTFEEATREADRLLKEKDRRSLVVHKSNWHAGVIGIVASRLVEKFNLPTILLTSIENTAKGSARSIRNFDIHNALKENEHLLIEFGGHKHAAGVTLKEENIPALREAIDEIAHSKVSTEMLIPEIVVDAELQLNELSPRFFEVLKRFAPYGYANTKPMFYAKNVQSANGVKIVGGNHLKLRTVQSNFVIDAIGFNLGHKLKHCTNGKPFSICFNLEENTYNGSSSPQISIKDIRPELS
jgi:single-stranded-DNA-specific exonuclease